MTNCDYVTVAARLAGVPVERQEHAGYEQEDGVHDADAERQIVFLLPSFRGFYNVKRLISKRLHYSTLLYNTTCGHCERSSSSGLHDDDDDDGCCGCCRASD